MIRASAVVKRQLIVLATALRLDANRPYDDMTALVLAIFPSPEEDATAINPKVRRMEIHIPI